MRQQRPRRSRARPSAGLTALLALASTWKSGVAIPDADVNWASLPGKVRELEPSQIRNPLYRTRWTEEVVPRIVKGDRFYHINIPEPKLKYRSLSDPEIEHALNKFRWALRWYNSYVDHVNDDPTASAVLKQASRLHSLMKALGDLQNIVGDDARMSGLHNALARVTFVVPASAAALIGARWRKRHQAPIGKARHENRQCDTLGIERADDKCRGQEDPITLDSIQGRACCIEGTCFDVSDGEDSPLASWVRDNPTRSYTGQVRDWLTLRNLKRAGCV